MAMQRDPLPIIKEFLAASERQVRKNAVVAMAALETEEAVVELVRTAVKDQDADTRRFAEEEILQLPADSLRGAARELGRELSDGGLAEPAYALLGRIRSHGIPTDLPSLPMKGRLKLARSLIRQLYPVRALAFRFRAMKKSLLALSIAVIAYCLISIGLLRTTLDASGTIAYGLLTAFAGGTLIFLCVQKITPIGLQPDPKASVLVQAGAIMVSSFLWVFIVAGLVFWVNPRMEKLSSFIVLLVLVPVVCVVVRLVTIGAIATTSGGWLNRYGPVMAGGCAGCILITAAVLNRWLYASNLIETMWALLIPSMFGLAAGFSNIDQTGPMRRVASRTWQFFSYGAVAVVFLAVGLASRISSAGPYTPPTITDSGTPNDRHHLDIVNSPTVVTVTLNSKEWITGQVNQGLTYCSATLTDTTTGTPVLYSPQTKSLPKGVYKLTVTLPYHVQNPDDVLKVFNSQLTARFVRRSQAAPLCSIELTLNVPHKETPTP